MIILELKELLLPSLNEFLRWHWTERKRYKERLAWQLVMAGVKKIEPIRKARLTLVQYTNRMFKDVDNLVGSFKALVDCLVDFGAILDDSPDYLATTYEQVKVKKNEGCQVKVYIEPIEML